MTHRHEDLLYISGKMALSITSEWESVKLKTTEALRTCEQIL